MRAELGQEIPDVNHPIDQLDENFEHPALNRLGERQNHPTGLRRRGI
jgi:hypothetical protein